MKKAISYKLAGIEFKTGNMNTDCFRVAPAHWRPANVKKVTTLRGRGHLGGSIYCCFFPDCPNYRKVHPKINISSERRVPPEVGRVLKLAIFVVVVIVVVVVVVVVVCVCVFFFAS